MMPGWMPPPAIQMGKRLSVVVPPVLLAVGISLGIGRAAELAAPDDEGIVEQAALLEILHERRGRLIHILADGWHPILQSAVMIPIAMVEAE